MSGTFNAINESVAVQSLRERGVIPTKLTPQTMGASASGGGLGEILGGGWPTTEDILLFTRQLQSLARAGIPILRAIHGLRESASNKRLADALGDITQELESGQSLQAAMAQHPRIFPEIYIKMVTIGEETGNLEGAFGQIFHYMETERETAKKIKSALRYPAFVLTFKAVALVIINLFVIPAFEEFFKKSGMELPITTRILLASSRFVQDFWPLLLLGTAGSIGGVIYFLRTPKGRLWWDKTKLRLPLVGAIINRATISRFARSFAMGIRSGLPLQETLKSVAGAVDNAYVGERIHEMRRGIERGESVPQAAFNTGLFTPLVMQMIAVGDETGQMDEMMTEVSEYYEREVEYDIKALSSAIEPIMLLFIGMLVTLLALGIFVPMWDMGQGAKH
ncbi:putative GspF family protein [Magnetofaba australis IT-1]|uniref:Putative GspF family protein n=1 Tax=Magnetofaba australis IT-1 TaxID=1434232 RepID=A0A1Y2K268_9PROT|nr:putative GspF family protein [Magnetofaba australis IT-1]